MARLIAALWLLVASGDCFAPSSPSRWSRRVPLAASSSVDFEKFQGLGNDFILVDNRGSPEPVMTPAQAAAMCDRNFGVGGDGVIFAMDSDTLDWKMRIYNSDGPK